MQLNIVAGWLAVVAGVVSGAIIGLSFHNEQYMGGYSSFRRRLTRLGHISFFGLGILNILFALSVSIYPLHESFARIASAGLIVGLITMPACCFLTAWREPLRRFFPIPVAAVLTAAIALLLGWIQH